MDSKVLGIISIKGGVGKTSCTTNLAAALSEFDKKVLVVDANFSAPNIGFHFGLPDPEVTLHDILTNKADAGDAIYEYNPNLHIIAGSLLNEKIDPFKLRSKINKLRGYYDIILIDSSPNLNNEILATMLAADELIVVTSPDYPTLSCTMHAVKLAKQRKTQITGLIINRVRNKNFELSLEEIEKATGVPVIGVLPEDIKVPESIAFTTPTIAHSPASNVSVEIKKIASALINQRFDDPRILPKIKRLFSRRLRKEEINRDLLIEGKLY